MAIKINGATVIDDSQAFTSTSTVSASGNITGGNIRTGGTISATGNLTAANLFSAGVISAAGNIIGGNISGNVIGTGPVSTTGTVTGGNIVTGGIVSATGNITGSFIIGNGSQLTGLPAGYSNADVNSHLAAFGSNTISTTGTVTAGNVTGSNILTAGRISAAGDVFGANALLSGNLTVNGNVTYINSNVVTINDLAINLANNAATAAAANNGGIEVGPQGTPYITFLYNSSANTMTSSGGLSAVGNVTGSAFNGAGTGLTGTAASLTVGVATVAGTVTTAAQPNITSVGTMSTATITTLTTSAITKNGANGVGNIGQTDNRFNTVFATATSAQYADLAEKYTADAEYAPGTVLVFGGTAEVTADAADADRRVAGVVSTNPAYIMNDALDSTHVATVALTGRVPCRVAGTVRKGDLMVSAGNGQARAEADPSVGTVIGKALADHDGAEGVIEVVVGRF